MESAVIINQSYPFSKQPMYQFCGSFLDPFQNIYSNLQIQKLQQRKEELDFCKENANKRLQKEKGKSLTLEQMKCIDTIILCDYIEKPRISFYEDKIKVKLESFEYQYMLDFDIKNFNGEVLVGIYDKKEGDYTIKSVSISNLKETIC